MNTIRVRRTLYSFLMVFALFTYCSSQITVWQQKLTGEGESVGLNPINPHTIYSQASDGRLNVSRNQGSTWTPLPSTPIFQIREIIVHPKDTLTIFIVNFSNDLWRTTDGGSNWSIVLSPFGIDGESVTYDPVHPDTMYAGNFGDGKLYRSTDRGTNWTLRGMIGTNLCALAVRPDSANILLAGSGSGRISKSTNGGVTWYQVKTAGSTEIPKIVINPANPQIAYGTAFSGSASVLGVWKTTNGGENWFLTNLQGINVWAMDMVLSDPNTLYVGTFEEYNAGMYKTTDGGTSWQFVKRGFLPYNSVWNLKIDQQDPTNVYAGVTIGSFGDNGAFKLGSANAGVEGVVRDTLNNNPVTTGYITNSPPGSLAFLSNTSGAYSFYRFPGDTVSNHTFAVTINSVLFKQQTITLINDSILQKDIFVVPGSIRGNVFNDLNSNGVKNGGETGLASWIVQMSGQATGSQASDVNGDYVFTDLFPGTYVISEQPKSGWTQTAPGSSTYILTVNASTRDFIGKDFGNHQNHGVFGVSPAPWSSTNPTSLNVQATFDTAMNTSLFNDTTAWVVTGSSSGRHRGSFSFSVGNTVATFTPTVSFTYGEVVMVDITKNLKTAINAPIAPYAYQFTIGSYQGPVTFYGRADYQVGSGPYGIALGDVDNDGDNDVVTANLNSNNISVLKNNSLGSFASKVDYTTGLGPVALVLVDIDNDGDLDIVTANSGASSITVLKNNGDGTFAAHVDYPAANPLFSISAGDVDGDGYVDVLTVGPSSGLVAVHKNNGSGGFPSHTDYTASGSPWSLVVADLDADGVLDAAEANAGSPSNIRTLQNLGGGVYTPLSSYTVGTNAHGVVVADVTGDNKPDLIALNSSSGTISVYPKSGGSFGPRADYSTGSLPWGGAVGDVNGDSLMDIFTANVSSNSLSILKNNGGGSFTKTDYSTGTNPHYVAVGDLDGDGDMDIVVTNSGTDSVSVFLDSFAQLVAHNDGWNLLSLPLLPANNAKTAVYPSATSSAFAYQGSYVPSNTLTFGTGYWLKFTGAGNQLVRGDQVTVDTIGVNPQWNMVGGLSLPVAVSSLTSIPGGIVSSNYFKYNGSYQVADTLKPGEGYWVKTTQAGQLAMASSGISPLNRIAELRGKYHTLSFRDNAGKTQTLYFSSNSGDVAQRDRYQLPPVPPAGSTDIRFASQRSFEVASEREQQLFPIQLNDVTYPLTVSWKTTPDDRQWVMTAGSVKHSLQGEGSLLIQRQPPSLILSAARSSSIEIPEEYILAQNYPNPFNPTTEIRYGLPAASKVTLTIFDVLGQEVARLVNEQQDAGYYHVSWSPANGSGIYFYKLSAVSNNDSHTSYVETKKMILLK